MIKLHHFHSSSTSFRVRIALELKRLPFERIPVVLRWKDADHDTPAYRAINPQGNVPLLETEHARLMQSLAIIDYLEHIQPTPPLYPADPIERARVLAIALHIACEIQPMNNLRVERYLADKLDDDELRAWRRHWITVGFDAIEKQLAEQPSTYCHGESPTVADCCLVPQVYNALRPVVGLELAQWPHIARVYEHCLAHPAVQAALPTHQPDYVDPVKH